MATSAKQANTVSKPWGRKIVVVHRRALVDKYKLSGYSKITAALASLVVNDGANGIKTKIVLVDSLVPKGGVAAIKARNAGKFKSAVDRIYTRERELPNI
ncbi:hypothetical protein VDQ03_02120 [Xanthomonas campestris pv. campestris]|nr:hypothetical protein [Xanthomonas campestris pv. campestris]